MKTPMLVAPSFDMLPLRQKDAGAIFSRWMTDKDVARYSTWFPHKVVDETHRFVAHDIQRNDNDDYYSWGLYFDDFSHGANRPRVFGHLTLILNETLEHGALGYNIMKPEWGKGYATEAVVAVLPFAFGTLGLQYVSASHHISNRASGRVLEKAGLVLQRQFSVPWKDGTTVSMIRYNLTREQFYEE